MINNKSLKIVVAILIIGYVGYGVLGRFFGPSTDEFYSNLFDNEQGFTAMIYTSASFEKSVKILNKDAVSQLISCLKSAKRTVANLGTNQDDRFYYIGLESDDYQYRFGFKWRPSTKMAYITGVEKKVDLRTGENISPAAFNKIGGSCFDKFLREI